MVGHRQERFAWGSDFAALVLGRDIRTAQNCQYRRAQWTETLTHVENEKSGNVHWSIKPCSLSGIPLHILYGTSGIEQPKAAWLFISPTGTGFRTHSRSCSVETIQTGNSKLDERRQNHRGKTYRYLVLAPNRGTG